MRLAQKAILGLIVLILLYGALLLAERMTTQELTRLDLPPTGQKASLMWRSQFLRGNGVAYLDLLDAQDKVVATAPLGTLDSGITALQQFGQLGFDGREITVAHQRTGEVAKRFVVREGRLEVAD